MGGQNRAKHIVACDPITIELVAFTCCTNQTLMEIYYVKKDGNKDRYEIEPYEIKDGGLYVFDTNADTIKRFNFNGIVSVADTGKKWNIPQDHKRLNYERKLISKYQHLQKCENQ